MKAPIGDALRERARRDARRPADQRPESEPDRHEPAARALPPRAGRAEPAGLEPMSSDLLDAIPRSRRRPRDSGAPRWMVTFADMMALLFALFVLLLSFAEIDSDSFKRNAGSMRDAFQAQLPMIKKDRVPLDQPTDDRTPVPGEVDEERWKNDLVYRLRARLATQLARGELSLHERKKEVALRFPDRTAFEAGSADLLPGILPTVDAVAEVLAETRGHIKVAGHTDDVPIQTARFRSNWELSAARAVSLVHRLLLRRDVEPQRINVEGFADTEPLQPNDTADGRAVNRRVEVVIRVPEPMRIDIFPGGR